ncbi:hypothetical protein TL16_g11757 [Triparma laevis f. inornata]|uniref:AAA+ ATPase domain-containing protein n=1 Tax=Triparma laevis f. inornata TaxID=1714386 RepID=A0A9W7BPM3_9STRA|nr:hypothetical protein TL16_g11757 [Triparma laevis f. inornata]
MANIGRNSSFSNSISAIPTSTSSNSTFAGQKGGLMRSPARNSRIAAKDGIAPVSSRPSFLDGKRGKSGYSKLAAPKMHNRLTASMREVPDFAYNISPNLNDYWLRLTKPETGFLNRLGIHSLVSAASHESRFLMVHTGGEQFVERTNDELDDSEANISLEKLAESDPTDQTPPPKPPPKVPYKAILTTRIKSVKMAGVPVGSNEGFESVVQIVFGVKSTDSYFSLCMDVRKGGKWVLVQSWPGGGYKKLGLMEEDVMRPGDGGGLKQNIFYSIKIEIKKGTHISVFANGMNVFNSVRVQIRDGEEGSEEKVPGNFGILCRGSRCVTKDWVVSHQKENGSNEYEYKMSNDDKFNRPEDERVVEMEYVGMDRDDSKFIDIIMSDVVDGVGISFDDIAGLGAAKQLLNEAVVWPLVLPQLFTGIREPWKGVLLFGPPGTGKTLLAKAVAGQNNSKFFNCSTATLVSKYRGESEKIVKCLFYLARHYAPSVVFLDEVDALVGARGAEGEHEASRRFKTELFVQIDGVVLSKGEENAQVTVLAASNNPWDLDEAMRRRLEKRIYVGLPDFTTRCYMFAQFIGEECADSSVDVKCIETLSGNTDGYSGADIELVVREAKMERTRNMLQEDLFGALERVKRTVKDCNKYNQWNGKFGSVVIGGGQ